MALPKRTVGGREVSAIGFGAMSLAGAFGPTNDDEAWSVMEAAIAEGIDFWDTANIYGMGVSETRVGRFLNETGADVFLATKVGIIPGPPRRFDNSADYIRAELEGSLTRLGRDKVDLYYIHRRDPEVEVEEVAETMGALIDEGLIGGWGLSEVAPFTLRRAHAVRPVTAVQNEYSLWTRQPDLGLIRACADLGVTFVPFSPVARGALTDHGVDPAALPDHDFRKTNPRFVEPNWSQNLGRINAFRALAVRKGVPTSALALAWVLAQGDHLIPIPGTRTAAHLRDWLPAATLALTEADLAEIDAILPAGWAWGDRYSPSQIFGVESYS